MHIEYAEPLTKGYNRMKKALFQPFDIKKWFVIGFTAFLAGLLDGNGGGSGGDHGGADDFGAILEAPYTAWNWLRDNQGWAMLILFGIALLFAIIVLLTWLSSRGKFMFLDNVVHDRALIAQPWREFGSLSTSLFIWRLFFGLVCFAIIISFLGHVWRSAYGLYYDDFSDVPWAFLIRMGFTLLLFVIALAYINLLLNEFVVPIMYKQRVNVLQAWNRLLAIHWSHLGQFILFALLWLILGIAVFVLVLVAGLLTCCIGYLLLIIPYIQSVVLLPVSFTFRSFSLEFLAQFGDEYDVFTASGAVIAPQTDV
ncbi:hypothetical protein JXA02_00340 [candidate division KSB1 bacterium]|nr:hypothetical protein [candidate division KSB1 bacterium]RQW11492.1 MAG: hypothetical protein EH222_00370 [candidate division KSB1 bacterium]